MKKEKIRKGYNPIFILIIITFIIMLFSFIFDMFGIDGEQAAVVNGTLETSIVVVKNIFSIEGLQYIFTHITSNFAVLEPLALLIISLMGISIGVTSGLFKVIFRPLRKLNLTIITFMTLLMGILGSFFGESAYVLLIPMSAVMYRYIGRNPMVGAMTAFLGITAGYGTNIIFTNDDYILGNLTELAATVEVDKTYEFDLMSNIYIMIASTVIFSFIGTVIINRFLVNKLPKKYKIEEEVTVSKKGIVVSAGAFLVMLGIIIYMILPGMKLPASGALLDFGSKVYINQLLGVDSPFRSGIILIITMMIVVCSFIYGKVSGTMCDNHEYGTGLSQSFKDLGYLFVLLFFVSMLISILEYTNIGIVLATRLIEFASTIPMSGIPLIVLTFFIVVVMSILIPGTETKWALASPLIVPLFMRANMTPDFTQFLFKVADGMGKCFSPIFVYFIVLIGFLQKYNHSSNEVTIFGTMKLMMPAIILFTVLWLLILIGWYVVGLPLGIGNYPTL